MGENLSLMWELNSISSLVFIEHTMKYFWASISSSPLFSSIVTLYALILLYFPYHFLRIVFSPVIIITSVLLLTLLRLGAFQRFEDEHKDLNENPSSQVEITESKTTIESRECNESKENTENRDTTFTHITEEDHSFFGYQSETDSEPETGFDPNLCFEDLFVEWNLKAPLEVIYEEPEGEEDELDLNENDPNLNRQKEENRVLGLERHPSLSMYYPESDSDSSSDGDDSATGAWDSPEKRCYKWEEEDREGLIEIALDGGSKRGLDFHVEEENLIEIDISPTRNSEFCGEKWQFSGEVRFS